MKKSINFLLLAVFLFTASVLTAQPLNVQSTRWAVPGKEINFNNYPATATNLNTGAVYDGISSFTFKDGEMLFMIVDDEIKSVDGTSLATIGNNADFRGPEISTIEIKDDCNSYITFYIERETTPMFVNESLCYSKYSRDPSTGAITMIANGVILSAEVQDAIGGIAMSQERPDGSRFLYYASTDSGTRGYLRKYTISASGLVDNGVEIYAGVNNQPFRMAELELSHDGTRLAFSRLGFGVDANEDMDVVIFELDPNTGNLSNPNPIIININDNDLDDNYPGLEFSADGSKLLVFHAGGGLYEITMSNYSVNEVLNFNTDYTYSMLELGRDGFYYFAKADGLYRMDNDYNVYPFASGTMAYNELLWIIECLVYVLPDQIDGQDYKTYEPSTDCCYKHHYSYVKSTMTGVSHNPTTGNITITGTNVNWTQTSNPFTSGGVPITDVYLRGKITINPGAKLTINGLNLYFKEGEQVELSYATSGQRGSQLFLQNSTLTVFDACEQDALWGGIYLSGINTLPQSPISTTRQPYLDMTNSTIEYAANYGVVSDQGGIVRMTSSNVKDCVNGVLLSSYPSNNQSRFTRTNFYTTDGLYDKGGIPILHCYLVGVKSINFNGCSFYNTNLDADKEDKGVGIFAEFSDFNVRSHCSSIIDPCPPQSLMRGSFSNLEYGIYSKLGNAITINKVDFNDCYGGAWLVGNDGLTITENDFDVYDNSNDPSTIYDVFGLYIESSTGYHIEQNLFRDGVLGLVIYNSGPYENLVYKNEFNNLFSEFPAAGFIGIGENVGPDLSGWPYGAGLQLKCNEFIDVFLAMAVTGGDIYTEQNGWVSVLESDIRRTQGLDFDNMTRISTYNYFDMSYIPWILDRYFNIDGNYSSIISDSQKYIYNQTNTPGYFLPYYNSNHIWVTDMPNETCPSTLGGGGGIIIPFAMGSIDSLNNEINDLDTEYSSLTANYNELELELLAQTASSYSSSTAFNSLSNASPYLTAEILIAYLHNTQVSELARASIMIENSPLPSKVLDELPKSDLSSQLISHILQLQTGVNPLEEIQNSIQQHKGAKQFITDRLVRETFIQDSSASFNNTYNQVVAFLSNQDDIYSKKRLVDLLIRKSEYQQAISVLDEIRQYSVITNNNRIADYVKLQSIKIDLMSNITGMPISEIVAKHQADLQHIAADYNTKEGGVARSILASAGLFDLQPIIIMPQVNNNKSYSTPSVFDSETVINDKLEPLFRIYPNPVEDELFVEFISPSNTSSFNIYNIQGQLVKTIKSESRLGFLIINVSDLKQGNYIIESPQLKTQAQFVITR